MKRLRISKLAVAVASVSFLYNSLPAMAADTDQVLLPEIIVTSQKREESLSDVPISVAVIDQAKLKSANINKIEDITEFVPNLTTTETGISTQMYIRGIGSGNNQAFEQSVGQYIDGVYYGRQQLIRAPFLDLERVEVLRGPQGILFGKNSIAGAINMTTAKPTDELEVELNLLYEFESEQEEFTGIISGPLSDNFRARLVYRGYTEEGYIKNTFFNRDEPQREEDAVRLTLDWDVNDRLNASLKIEKDTFDTVGRQIEVIKDAPNLFPQGATPLAGLNLAQILGAFGQPAMDGILNFQRQANVDEFSNSDLDNITLNVNYELGDNTLTYVAAMVDYDFTELCDCDYTPASIFEVTLGEEFEQFSQEIRLSSPTGESLEWTMGAYYQSTEMDSIESFNVPTNTLLNILAATSADPSVQALTNISGTSAVRLNNHESNSWAVFAQATWSVADNMRLTLGGRYTDENKDAFRILNILDTASGQNTANPIAPLVYFGGFDLYSEQLNGFQVAPGVFLPGHTLRGSRSETSFTPLINLQWEASDATMIYVSATRGFKGGGFDARANNPFSFEFNEEETTAFELGSKNVLANGALELNLALFFTDYDALQISQFDGALGFNVGNAKNTDVTGLEIDGRLAISNNLTMSYAYSYLDFEFTDFNNGNCYNRQVPNGDVVNGIPLCSYTGSSGIYTPENNYSLSFDYYRGLTNNIEFVSSLSFNFTGEQNVHDNLDPGFKIDSFTKVNLKIGLETENWSVAMIGKNITDEEVLSYAGNVPISASTFGTNSFYGFVTRPRQVALEANYRF